MDVTREWLGYLNQLPLRITHQRFGSSSSRPHQPTDWDPGSRAHAPSMHPIHVVVQIVRCGRVQAAQEVGAAGFALFASVDTQVDPARSAVNSQKLVSPRRVVGHSRQVLDVDVEEAWLALSP